MQKLLSQTYKVDQPFDSSFIAHLYVQDKAVTSVSVLLLRPTALVGMGCCCDVCPVELFSFIYPT